MLGVGKAAPAQFFAAFGGSEFTAQERRRSEDRLGGSLPNVYFMTLIQNIGFNRPLQKEKDILSDVLFLLDSVGNQNARRK